MERAYLSTAGLTVSPATLRRVREITVALARHEKQHAQRARQKLRPITDPREQILGWTNLVKSHYLAMENCEAEMFNIYRGVIDAAPADKISMHSIMLDQVAHDMAHLDDDCGRFLQWAIKGRTIETEQVSDQVSNLIAQSNDFFHFRNYPLYLMAALLHQYAGKQPKLGQVQVSTLLQMVALSQFFRAAKHPGLAFQIEPYSINKAQDPEYTGVLLDIEPGLALRTIEPYLASIVFNLAKNFFAITLWDKISDENLTFEKQKELRGAKLIFSAKQHPQLPEIILLETIDNGPGFDLGKLAQQALALVQRQQVIPGLSAETQDVLNRLNGSPYAYQIGMNQLMETVFLHRLSGQTGSTNFHTGLGLFGAANYKSQLRGEVVVGMNHAGIPPFSTGARFMLLLPTDPHHFLPDLHLLTQDIQYGALGTPHFKG